MQRLMKQLGVSVAAFLVLAALAGTVHAQVIVQAVPAPCPVPVVTYYAAPAQVVYSAPVVAYSPPVYVRPTQYSFYGPTPAVAQPYAVTTTTQYRPLLGNRTVTTTYYTPAYAPGYYTGYYTPLFYRP